MVTVRTALVVLMGTALASSSALAFQEQQTGVAPAPPASQQPAPAAAPAADPSLGISTQDVAKSAEGTEVSIPGLGKVGVLPKMDFGLELLYGAADQKLPDLPQADPSDDDLRVRGTIKHNF